MKIKPLFLFALTFGLLTGLCLAQTAVLAPKAVQQFFDTNGKPCNGCLLYTYASGTSNSLSTFTDATGSTALPNPIVINSSGFPQNASNSVTGMFLTPGLAYRFKLTTSAGVLIWLEDNVTAYAATAILCESGSAAAVTGNGAAQTLFTCTVPANTLAAGQGLRVSVQWKHTTGTASVAYALTVQNSGGTSYGQTFSDTGTAESRTRMQFINTAALQTQQYSDNGPVFDGTTVAAAPTASPGLVDFTQAATVIFTFNVANTDAVTPEFFMVEQIR